MRTRTEKPFLPWAILSNNNHCQNHRNHNRYCGQPCKCIELQSANAKYSKSILSRTLRMWMMFCMHATTSTCCVCAFGRIAGATDSHYHNHKCANSVRFKAETFIFIACHSIVTVDCSFPASIPSNWRLLHFDLSWACGRKSTMFRYTSVDHGHFQCWSCVSSSSLCVCQASLGAYKWENSTNGCILKSPNGLEIDMHSTNIGNSVEPRLKSIFFYFGNLFWGFFGTSVRIYWFFLTFLPKRIPIFAT